MGNWNKVGSYSVASNKTITFSTSTLSPWAFLKGTPEPPSPWKDNNKSTWAEANAEGWYSSTNAWIGRGTSEHPSGIQKSAIIFSDVTTIISDSTYNVPTTVSGMSYDAITRMSNKSTLTKIGGKGITGLGRNTFANCTNLTTVSFPACTEVPALVFEYCSALTSVYLPQVSMVCTSAFRNCTSLSYIKLDNCISFDVDYAEDTSGQGDTKIFHNCTALSIVDLPKCKNLGNTTFEGCTALTSVSLPDCEYIGGDMFPNASLMTTLSLPKCSYIGWGINGYNQTYIQSLYLMSTSVVSIENMTFFSGCPTVYVPSNLVSAYKSASIWSKYASNIVAYNE